MQTQQIKIVTADANKRIDAFLATQLDVSRARIQKLITQEQITVNGQPTKTKYKIQENDTITINIPAPTQTPYKAIKIPLEILFEDTYMLIINKPANISVHPRNEFDETPTIVNAILHHCPQELSGIGGTLRPGIVHRLDKETSGALIIAKDDKTHQALSEQFANRTIKKIYQTLVVGVPNSKEGIIEAPIVRHPVDRKKMTVMDHDNARPSKTSFTILQTFSDKAAQYSLLKINLHTGRTHQIRVHMQAIKHPVVGDKLYGNSNTNSHFTKEYQLERQFLHAHSLTFTHPHSKEEIHITAPLATDLQQTISHLQNQ